MILANDHDIDQFSRVGVGHGECLRRRELWRGILPGSWRREDARTDSVGLELRSVGIDEPCRRSIEHSDPESIRMGLKMINYCLY